MNAVLCTGEIKSKLLAVLELDKVTDVTRTRTESARFGVFIASADQVGFTWALSGIAVGFLDYRAQVYKAVSVCLD